MATAAKDVQTGEAVVEKSVTKTEPSEPAVISVEEVPKHVINPRVKAVVVDAPNGDSPVNGAPEDPRKSSMTGPGSRKGSKAAGEAVVEKSVPETEPSEPAVISIEGVPKHVNNPRVKAVVVDVPNGDSSVNGAPEVPRKSSMTGPSSRKGSRADGPRKSRSSRKGSLWEKPIELDDVLINELGQFGRYQLQNMLLVAIPIIMSAFMSEYIFSAAAVPHRCRVPECGENTKSEVFEPSWLGNAVPETSSGFESCERFAPAGGNGTLDFCPASLFNQPSTIPCDGFVYDRDNSVVYDFDLGCQEWLRALAGTLNSVGTLLVLPITGYVSDRFGRRTALVISVFNLGLIGLIRAFSVNYPMYLAMQILQTTLGAGTFSSAYVFATEMVGPKWRVITSATCSSLFSVGQVYLGSMAWLVQPWRYMIMALHIPCFLIVSYYWILSESVRWLLSKQKFNEARQILEKVAKVNKRQISEKSLHALMNPPTPVAVPGEEVMEKPSLLKAILQSRVLLRRVFTTPIWWITTTFVYYGLSINSTGLSGNMYLNYILVCAIEIPGFYTAVLVLNRIGRKPTLTCGFFLSSACNIAFAFIDEDLATLRLVLFLVGKFGISVTFTSLYLFTSELYPTEYRHTLLAFSSMIGRIGSITAPLTPVLMEYWQGLPSLMFGVMGLLSGCLVLTQPETLGTKMPDTLAEAEAIGRKKVDS